MNRRKSILVVAIVLMAIGFASISTTLLLNGKIGIASNKADFNVIFTGAKLNNQNKSYFIDKETKQTIKFKTNRLTKLNEEAVLEYEVTNTSRNYNADVEILCNIVDEEDNIISNNEYIAISYAPNSMTVEAGKVETGSITAKLIKVTTENQSINVKCSLNATAVDRVDLGEEYIAPFSKAGTIMATAVDLQTKMATDKFWLYRNNITRIVFENEITTHDTSKDLTFDVSEDQDGSVMAYLVPNGENLTITKDFFDEDLENTTAYTLYIGSETGIKANEDSTALFFDFSNLIEIKNMEYLDTSDVTSMVAMLDGCKSLTELDVSYFDTSKVNDMNSMFGSCEALTTLDVSSFDTSNVVDMSFMFNRLFSLTSLDLSNFDTSNVAYMYAMFQACTELRSLDVSSFDTSKVKNMSRMFFGCFMLKSLDLSNFDIGNVGDMEGMFANCSKLKELDISNFDTSNVKKFSSMFYNLPANAKVKVKDDIIQNWILTNNNGRPSTWSTDNVIIV